MSSREHPNASTFSLALSTLAAQFRSSPTIPSDVSKACPALKQRIDGPRARANPNEIAILPLFSLSSPSFATLVIHSPTFFEPHAPLATPSILVSSSLNISQPLGADIT
ncbi:hypothetical protein EV715DRAFT_292037 [Schizophyllum commune]